MEPQIVNGTVCFLSKTNIDDLKRGELVLVRNKESKFISINISRVFAFEDEQVILTDSSTYLNGKMIEQNPQAIMWTSDKNERYYNEKIGDEEIVASYNVAPWNLHKNDTIIVPKNSFLVLSDRRYRRWNNINRSIIKADELYGKVRFSY